MQARTQGIILGLIILSSGCTHNVETGQATVSVGKSGTPLADPDSVETLVKDKLNDLDRCYQEERQRNPKANGKAMFSFEILKNGQTDAVRLLASTLKSPVMEGCLVGRIEAWKFPPPSKGEVLKVRYPFSFEP